MRGHGWRLKIHPRKEAKEVTDRKYYALINWFYHNYHDMEKNRRVLLNISMDYREKICSALCNYNFKLSRKQALLLCDNLGQGNWKKMWLTPEEEQEPTEEICRDFIGDIFYCSDRMSWDRLARINWQYQRLLKRIGNE